VEINFNQIKSEISSEETLYVELKDSLCQFKTDIIMLMMSIFGKHRKRQWRNRQYSIIVFHI